MAKDKKNVSDKINLILLKKVGHPIIEKSFNKKIVADFLKKN